MANGVYTRAEACAILKVHKNTLLRWLTDGTIKGFKVGSRWRIKKEEIDRILQNNGSKER